MKRLIVKGSTVALLVAALAFPLASPAFADQNPTTGQPGQSCQAVVAAGGSEPGNASGSPGSPFNEPTDTSLGGIGGQNYAGNGSGSVDHAGSTAAVSQYDVACLMVSTHTQP